jgi:hypothetical protein
MAASILQMVNRQRVNGHEIYDKIRKVPQTIISMIKFIYIQDVPGGNINIPGGIVLH